MLYSRIVGLVFVSNSLACLQNEHRMKYVHRYGDHDVYDGPSESNVFGSSSLREGEWLTRIKVWHGRTVDWIHRVELETNLGKVFGPWGFVKSQEREAERRDCKISYFSGMTGSYIDFLNVIWDC